MVLFGLLSSLAKDGRHPLRIRNVTNPPATAGSALSADPSPPGALNSAEDGLDEVLGGDAPRIECRWEDELICDEGLPFMVFAAVWVLGALGVCLAFWLKLRHTRKYLAKRIYQDFRLQNILLNIQVRPADALRRSCRWLCARVLFARLLSALASGSVVSRDGQQH